MNNDEIHQELYAVMWGDLDEKKQFPAQRPLLAHYTSLANLEEILRTEQVWFSHPFAMNDLQELRFGFKHGKQLFERSEVLRSSCPTHQHLESLNKAFDYYFGQIDEGALDIYVFCLSKHTSTNRDGRLSMWRGYGADGNGAALIFDTKKLIPQESGVALRIAPVVYKNEGERISLIDGKLKELASLIKKLEPLPEQMYLFAYAYLQRLLIFSLFSKDAGFKEENEWRVVYVRSIDESARDPEDSQTLYERMLSYSVTKRGVLPRLKLDFKKLRETGALQSLEDLIKEIILGPSAAPSAFERLSVVRMLETLGYKRLAKKVRVSQTPYKSIS